MRRGVSALFRAVAGSVAILVAIVPASSGHAQQQPKPPGTYDGKYAGTMRCFGHSNARVNGLTVRQGRFVFSFKTTRGAGTLSCAVQIKSDGTFDNQACDLPMSGKVTGDTLQASFKSPDALCDFTVTREKN